MAKIMALGELLVDFTPAGDSQANNPLFEFNPGGSVANFSVAVAKNELESIFVGQVGNDMFGKMLKECLESYGVNTDNLTLSDEYKTTLAFVRLFEDGDRDFSFYRKNGADTMYSTEQVKNEMFDGIDAFHFSSLSLVNETCKAATYKAIELAKANGAIITYDPNWRPSLWENAQQCKEEMYGGIKFCDILKLSEEELEYLCGEDIQKAVDEIFSLGVKIFVLTLGDKGSKIFTKQGSKELIGYKVKAVDATGAGDTCFGTFVSRLMQYIQQTYTKIEDISLETLSEILDFANAAAALSVTKRGGMPSVPNIAQVEEFMKKK